MHLWSHVPVCINFNSSPRHIQVIHVLTHKYSVPRPCPVPAAVQSLRNCTFQPLIGTGARQKLSTDFALMDGLDALLGCQLSSICSICSPTTPGNPSSTCTPSMAPSAKKYMYPLAAILVSDPLQSVKNTKSTTITVSFLFPFFFFSASQFASGFVIHAKFPKRQQTV